MCISVCLASDVGCGDLLESAPLILIDSFVCVFQFITCVLVFGGEMKIEDWREREGEGRRQYRREREKLE